jgi:hypothetical protein
MTRRSQNEVVGTVYTGVFISTDSTYFLTASVVYWSEFLATDPEVRVRFPVLPDFF